MSLWVCVCECVFKSNSVSDWVRVTDLGDVPVCKLSLAVQVSLTICHSFTYLQSVCVYLNRPEAALVACVATNRQEEETPAITASETATNPGPLGNRRTLGGCLYTHIHTHKYCTVPSRHPQKNYSAFFQPLLNCSLAATGTDPSLDGETDIYDKFYWNHCCKQIINIETVKNGMVLWISSMSQWELCQKYREMEGPFRIFCWYGFLTWVSIKAHQKADSLFVCLIYLSFFSLLCQYQQWLFAESQWTRPPSVSLTYTQTLIFFSFRTGTHNKQIVLTYWRYKDHQSMSLVHDAAPQQLWTGSLLSQQWLHRTS